MEDVSKVGIVACSNAMREDSRGQIERLIRYLQSIGKSPVISSCIYEREGVFSGAARERIDQLMQMFASPDIEEIYDISGGDIANQILDYLDYDVIADSQAVFWGYSDLTTVINAIYKMTGRSSVLYQVRNLSAGGSAETAQRERFQNRAELFAPRYEFVRGNVMSGVVVGGNIRCFLKLAGTRYFPELEDKLLLLESLGGEVPQMVTYLSQLKQIGAFDKISGIILGTFIRMEESMSAPDIVSLVEEYADPDTPIAVTRDIGHRDDSRAIMIGERIEITA